MVWIGRKRFTTSSRSARASVFFLCFFILFVMVCCIMFLVSGFLSGIVNFLMLMLVCCWRM